MSEMIGPLSPLAIVDGTMTEASHVLTRVSVAGVFGIGAGPIFFYKLKSPLPTWRAAKVGASALASCSLPFLCMERLAYHSIINSVSVSSGNENNSRRNELYASHALGTVLGAGLLHVLKRSKGRFMVPLQVLGPMLCKAQLEAVFLIDE